MSSITQQIRACLIDEDTYKKTRKPILQQVTSGNKLYATTLVDIVKTNLKDKKENGISKFISLYLLKEAMDTRELELVHAVRDNLLKILGELAKSKISEIFPPETDKKVMRNFDQLLLECIMYWAEWFGKDTKNNLTKYQTIYEEVCKRVNMPKKISFFASKPRKSSMENPPENISLQKKESMTEKVRIQELNPLGDKLETMLSCTEGLRDLIIGALPHKNKSDFDALMVVNGQLQQIDVNLKEASGVSKYIVNNINHDKLDGIFQSVKGVKDILIWCLVPNENADNYDRLVLIQDQLNNIKVDLEDCLQMPMIKTIHQIRLCLSDQDSYYNHKNPVLQQVLNNNRLYINTLVDLTRNILKDKTENGTVKFISLYLLRGAMRTKNPELIYSVRDRLLKTLSEIAKDDIKKVFPPGTSDKIIKNFIQLLLECIMFWADSFGRDSKNKPTEFQMNYDEVFDQVKLPKRVVFFSKELKDSKISLNRDILISEANEEFNLHFDALLKDKFLEVPVLNEHEAYLQDAMSKEVVFAPPEDMGPEENNHQEQQPQEVTPDDKNDIEEYKEELKEEVKELEEAKPKEHAKMHDSNNDIFHTDMGTSDSFMAESNGNLRRLRIFAESETNIDRNETTNELETNPRFYEAN